MNAAPVRLAAFGAVLALAFGGATLVGAAIDPSPEASSASPHAMTGAGHAGKITSLSGLATTQDATR